MASNAKLDVEIRTEYAVMRRWIKGAKAKYDEQGRLREYNADSCG